MKIFASLKIVAVAVLSLGLVAGCASQSSPKSSSAKMQASGEVSQAIKAAEAAIAKAKANNWIWRDTEKTLKKAKEAAEKGDKAKAVKLADTARKEAELAVEQYQLEQNTDRGLRS